MTTKHNVNGVERNRPTGPQIQVQNVAAAKMAKGDSPVLRPYNIGSKTLPVRPSTTAYSPAV